MKPLLLCILDGVGIRNDEYGNAFKAAHTPHFDALWNIYPHSVLEASGVFVGLPKGQMGNSEVGHMNIGAGRVVYQPLEIINQSIDSGSFFENEEILKVIHHTKENNSKLHLMGLISDGGVHSHVSHLLALLDLCQKENMRNVYLHLFTDGRDTDPHSAYSYIDMVLNKCREIGFGSIATISGRYYAMDRDNHYDRLQKAYDAIVKGEGKKLSSIKELLYKSYQSGITDEFLLPTILDEEGMVSSSDGIITFNFRKDRLRELLTAITNPSFHKMDVALLENLKVVTMFPVTKTVLAPFAFADTLFENSFGSYLATNNLSQLRIAETEKYAHVTFFFDGGKEVDYPKEKKILVPSPNVATYDLRPEMSAIGITEKLIQEMENFDVIILNFANGDMLGHTGVIEATIKGLETVDKCLGKIYRKIEELGGTMIVTADHGNCEEMRERDGTIITCHSTNLVPFIVTKKGLELRNGKIGDIAPTMLSLLNLPIPSEMTGTSLIKESK